MCKGNDSNVLLILATWLPLPMSFVDLGDGPEDSEFEDLEDEFDVKPMPLHMYNLLYNFFG